MMLYRWGFPGIKGGAQWYIILFCKMLQLGKLGEWDLAVLFLPILSQNNKFNLGKCINSNDWLTHMAILGGRGAQSKSVRTYTWPVLPEAPLGPQCVLGSLTLTLTLQGRDPRLRHPADSLCLSHTPYPRHPCASVFHRSLKKHQLSRTFSTPGTRPGSHAAIVLWASWHHCPILCPPSPLWNHPEL